MAKGLIIGIAILIFITVITIVIINSLSSGDGSASSNTSTNKTVEDLALLPSGTLVSLRSNKDVYSCRVVSDSERMDCRSGYKNETLFKIINKNTGTVIIQNPATSKYAVVSVDPSFVEGQEGYNIKNTIFFTGTKDNAEEFKIEPISKYKHPGAENTFYLIATSIKGDNNLCADDGTRIRCAYSYPDLEKTPASWSQFVYTKGVENVPWEGKIKHGDKCIYSEKPEANSKIL